MESDLDHFISLYWKIKISSVELLDWLIGLSLTEDVDFNELLLGMEEQGLMKKSK